MEKQLDTIKMWEGNFRPWTIKDAKEGDVLVASQIGKLGEQIFIFKGISNRDYAKNCINYYCRVHRSCFRGRVYGGGFRAFEEGYMGTATHSADIHPATKEQRDILEKAMTNAGYRWDAENKRLVKITRLKGN